MLSLCTVSSTFLELTGVSVRLYVCRNISQWELGCRMLRWMDGSERV